MSLLEIRNLHICLPEGSEREYAVEAVDLDLAPNEILCVVGESGSGKSLTARAVMGLLPKPHVRVVDGGIRMDGEDLVKISDARMREIRGSAISMIFQEPMTALNPVMTIGDQIDEVFRFHVAMSRKSGASERWPCCAMYICPIRNTSCGPIHMSCPAGSANVR